MEMLYEPTKEQQEKAIKIFECHNVDIIEDMLKDKDNKQVFSQLFTSYFIQCFEIGNGIWTVNLYVIPLDDVFLYNNKNYYDFPKYEYMEILHKPLPDSNYLNFYRGFCQKEHGYNYEFKYLVKLDCVQSKVQMSVRLFKKEVPVYVWLYNTEHCLDIANRQKCTYEFLKENFKYIGQIQSQEGNWVKDICNNMQINKTLYDWHGFQWNRDKNGNKCLNVFVSPYKLNTHIEKRIENRNNAICPVCGYVDYYCWENNTPDENYRCPQCKSSLLLEHNYDSDVFCEHMWLMQTTTVKQIHKPKKFKLVKELTNV